MAQLRGTPGRDVFTVSGGDNYDALEGDDEITLASTQNGPSANVTLGPGNDKVISLGDANGMRPWAKGVVNYWSSPGAVYVDLKEGYALDGFGTRDTLIDVRRVHGLSRDGDKAFGTEDSDDFWVGSPWGGGRTGTVFVDGRGGYDSVGINLGRSAQDNFGDLRISVSADGRSAKMWFSNHPRYIIELKNCEEVNPWNPETERSSSIILADLISFETAGPDILLRGASGWQLQGPSKPVTITYSFLSTRPVEGADGGTGFVAFNAAQQKVVRDVFARLQEQTGVIFAESTDGKGDIRFGINQQADTRGYAFVPDFHRGLPQAGDVWLDVESAAVMNPGQEGFYALLHELGHALGLQHPLAESDNSGAVVLLSRFASLSNTVMLERSAAETGGTWPTWFGSMDLQALRYLYGSKAYAAGPDRYMLSELAMQGQVLILDDGGDDTLDATGAPLGASIDLRPGRLTSIGIGASGDPLRNNVALAIGTVIENAVGSAHDDVIIGSDAANRLQGGGGSDLLDGQGGTDWAVFNGARSFWAVEQGLGGNYWFVSSRDASGGLSEVRRIERLRFDDKAIALDMARTDSGGQALLLIGAVLGKELTMAKAALVGQVIDLFDQGFNTTQLAGALMRLPIWGGVLTPTDSSEDIARYLLRLNKGAEPTAAELAAGVQSINNQAQGSFLATLAQSDANVALIGLSGLAVTGFEYPIGG